MANTQSILFDVLGEYETQPELRVQPTAQRAAPTANVGWKYRRRCTITNVGALPVANYPYAIDLGDTTPLTTTKAQADGDDLRVWRNGLEVARTLVNWDSASPTTLVWVVIPYLGPGETMVYDIVYGNASAVTPPTLTAGDDLPAFDIATAGAGRSTNAKWIYQVDRTVGNAGKGGWHLSSGTAQPDVDFSVPGAWQPVNTLLSDDDRNQQSSSEYTATGTKYQGRFEARRARSGTQPISADNGADGVSIRLPGNIESVRADIRWTNLAIGDTDATPVGKVVILTRNNEGETWKTLYENAALQATEATIATATYTPVADVAEMAFAVWAQDGNEISAAARADRYVNAAWYTTLELNLDSTILTQSLGSEVEVYELATELRSGGGGDAVGIPPYKSIFLGNAKSASGVGTPRLAVELNQQVVVKTAERVTEVWNSGLTAKVEDAPIPAVSAVDGVLLPDGTTTERPSTDWMPFVPQVDPLTNSSFDTDASGWTRSVSDVLMVADALVRDTVVFSSTPASGKVVVTANTGGTGDRVIERSQLMPVGNRQNVSFGAALRTTNVNLRPRLSIGFYDATGAAIALLTQMPNYTVTAADTWYRRVGAADVPEGAVSFAVNIDILSVTANQTGTVWFDTVAINDTEVALIDVAIGAITLSARWLDRYSYA